MKTRLRIKRYIGTGNNQGVALVYVVILLIALIAFVGLAIDIGYMYVTKTELQNAADSAALAGASRLNVTESYVFDLYTSSISESIKFGGANRATQKPVVISSGLTNSIGSNVFTDGNPGNDITVGNWERSRNPSFVKAGDPGGTPVNAVQVRARRTGDSPGGSVAVFFGKLFGIEQMPAVSVATATPTGFVAAGLSICTETCTIVTPVVLELQNEATTSGAIAWTSFSYDQAPNIGNNGDVVNIIWQRPTANPVPINVCTPPVCITTNNGVGDALKELDKAFKDLEYDKIHKIIVNKKVERWTIAVPVLNDDPVCLHEPGTACPPGQQGHTQERYHILKWALMEISDIITTGSKKGVLVTNLQCTGCVNPPVRIPNQPAKLVKE